MLIKVNLILFFAFLHQQALLTYSIYFSYAIFLTDYKKILKVAGGVKQLTVPLLPDQNCSMPENDAQCVIPVKCCISFKTMLCPNFLMVWYADIILQWICGYVHVYKIIKQLCHACSGNSSQVISSTKGQ